MLGANLPGALLFMIPIVAIIAGVFITWIRAKHGLLETSEELNETLRKELAIRDEQIAEQEKRIQVLERIVTDYDAKGLERDIERLSS